MQIPVSQTVNIDGKTFDDYSPYDGGVWPTLPTGKRRDAGRACDAAAEAFPDWSYTSPEEYRKSRETKAF